MFLNNLTIADDPPSNSRRGGYNNYRVKVSKVIDKFNIINITKRLFYPNNSLDKLFLEISLINYNRATTSQLVPLASQL